MPDLTAPEAGARRVLRPYDDGGCSVQRLPLEDPLAGATDEERAFYLAHYQGLSMPELLHRLRNAEWNAKFHKAEAEAWRRQARQYPPLDQIRAAAVLLKRVRALLDVPRRRTVPKTELAEALNGPIEDAPADCARVLDAEGAVA